MKKLMLVVLAVVLVAGWAGYVFSQEKPDAAKMQEYREIKMKMMAIERKAMAEDTELKQIAQQMKELEMKRKARLETVLAGNQEYQELKKKEEELRPTPTAPPKPAEKPEVKK
ncbi:MAG TPA: hypothetical protein PKX93_01700 [bacterium]|nr:hypothetical protein [bacterium]HOL66156.1 hypothetical protein [bacterium]HPP11455.1 hypothetical protein [bacterium]